MLAFVLQAFSHFRRGHPRGQATVEFAISSFTLIIMLGGLIDFSRAWYYGQVLQNAAREGVRHGIWFDVSTVDNNYLYDTAIKGAVDTILNQNGLPDSTLQNPGTTCPSPTDGNSYYNPPYDPSIYPTAPNSPYLYICYNNSPGTDYTSDPLSTTHKGEDLQVILIMRYGLSMNFMQSILGNVDLNGDAHGMVQGY